MKFNISYLHYIMYDTFAFFERPIAVLLAEKPS